MPLFCYVHRAQSAAPYFEVLPDVPRAEAERRARELMAERSDATRAELWEGDRLIATLEPAT